MLKVLEGITSRALFFILLFQITKVNAQNEEAKNNNGDSYISLDLTTFLDIQSPRYRMGYIRTINDKWKFGLEAGYGNRSTSLYAKNQRTEIGEAYKLWEIRPELFWIENPEDKTKRYLSLDVFYVNHKDVFFNGKYYKDDRDIKYSSANYQRQKYGFNIKYGFIIDFSNRIKLNIYSGLGFRIRNNSFTNAIITSDEPSFDGLDSIIFGESYLEKEGKHFSVNFPLGIKLFYRL